jgi:lysophospholipase L1-like esterase
MRRLAVRLASILFGVTVGLAAAEGALRLAGFSFQTYPTVQFGWPNPRIVRDDYVPDRDLFWVTRNYAEQLASARRTRPAVVFTGDSCTQYGTYPSLTLANLGRTTPGFSTGVNLGVGGWSSEQGLRALRRDVLALRPSVLTIYYGWNDHWAALGPADGEVQTDAVSWWLTLHSRVWQLGLRVRFAVPASTAGRPERVSVESYASNLETMAHLAHGAGIGVVFITAPANHEQGHEPQYLARRHLRRLEDLVPLHQRYVEATRRAAAQAGAVLCDAAAVFEKHPARSSLFMDDGIHLKPAGDKVMADLLVPCVLRAGVPADTPIR